LGYADESLRRNEFGAMGLRWVGVVLGLLVPWVNDITLESLGGVGSTLGGYQIQAAAINTLINVP